MPFPDFLRAFSRAKTMIMRCISQRIDRIQDRLVAQAMLNLTDESLRDIGLQRCDIHSTLNSRSALKTTTQLRLISVERRAASKAKHRKKAVKLVKRLSL